MLALHIFFYYFILNILIPTVCVSVIYFFGFFVVAVAENCCSRSIFSAYMSEVIYENYHHLANRMAYRNETNRKKKRKYIFELLNWKSATKIIPMRWWLYVAVISYLHLYTLFRLFVRFFFSLISFILASVSFKFVFFFTYSDRLSLSFAKHYHRDTFILFYTEICVRVVCV